MNNEAPEQRGGAGGVIAVERALSVLDAFTDDDRTLSLAALSRRIGLSKPTVLRLARSLAKAGYLIRNEDATWRLGPKVVRLGMCYQASFRVAEAVEPFLLRLSQQTGESAALYVREGDARICLYRVDSPQAIGHRARVGDMLPLDRGSPGRVILAFSGESGDLYDQIREQGYHVTFGERDPEVSSIACPVFKVGPTLFGVLAVVGPTSRFGDEAVERHLAILSSAAAEFSVQLGGKREVRKLPAKPQMESA